MTENHRTRLAAIGMDRACWPALFQAAGRELQDGPVTAEDVFLIGLACELWIGKLLRPMQQLAVVRAIGPELASLVAACRSNTSAKERSLGFLDARYMTIYAWEGRYIDLDSLDPTKKISGPLRPKVYVSYDLGVIFDDADRLLNEENEHGRRSAGGKNQTSF